jgi:hypothetical protein
MPHTAEEGNNEPMARISQLRKLGRLLNRMGLATVILLTGCSTLVPIAPPATSAVADANTFFYHLDPRLVHEPDGILYRGTVVTILGQQLGFNRVKLTNGETGFVAARDLSSVQTPSSTGARISAPRSPNLARQVGHGDEPELPAPEALDMSDTPLPQFPTGREAPKISPPILSGPSVQ